MSILSAEIHFRKGLALLAENQPRDAQEQFRQAITIERQRGTSHSQMRYVSYFGYASALADGATPEAVRACERAARQDFYNADLMFNLGRVYVLAGKTSRALAAFERGLKLAPNNTAIRAALARVDRRVRPLLPFLKRSHPLNRWLGRVRHVILARSTQRLSPRRTVNPS